MADHIDEFNLDLLHKEGACLTRHQPRTKGHQCSHQWQAQERAENEDFAVYAYPAYKPLCGEGDFRTASRATTAYPQGFPYAFFKKKPKPTEWDPKKNGNFEHFTKPYWHNAHHMVPNGALKNAINKTADSDYRLPELIKAGLLRGNYNLNGKRNMIILPQGKNVANALGLPRHLKGDESTDGQKPEYFSHSDYSRSVEEALEDVMMDFESSIDVETHPEEQGPLQAEKLDELSDIIHAEIISRGRNSNGASLSELGF